MFLLFLLIVPLFSASQSADTDISRPETIAKGNPSALNLTMCGEGFTILNGVCVDVDECQTKNKCPDRFSCVNTIGSFDCIFCPPGERPIPETGQCTCNHEECSKMYGRACQSLDKIYGGPACLCAPGFLYDFELFNCKPRCPFGSSLNFTSSPKVDCGCPETHERHGSFCLKGCEDRGDCNGGKCVSHKGYLVCACPKGFKLNHSRKQCIDVDECRSRRRRCRPDDVCANVPGGYVCLNFKCDQGFTPQTELGLCLKEENGITHLMRKTAFGLIMRDIKENQPFLTTKLPKAYKLELWDLKIHPEEFVKFIQVSIQSGDDGSRELIMKSIKPFPRGGKVTIDVIAEASEDAFIYKLRTKLYVYRLPFTVDIIGHD